MTPKRFRLVSSILLGLPAIGLTQSATKPPDLTGVWGIYRGGRGADPKFAAPPASPRALIRPLTL